MKAPLIIDGWPDVLVCDARLPRQSVDMLSTYSYWSLIVYVVQYGSRIFTVCSNCTVVKIQYLYVPPHNSQYHPSSMVCEERQIIHSFAACIGSLQWCIYELGGSIILQRLSLKISIEIAVVVLALSRLGNSNYFQACSWKTKQNIL